MQSFFWRYQISRAMLDDPARYRAYLLQEWVSSRRASGQASDSGEIVESRIEAQDPLDTVDLHHGEVHRISRRQRFLTQHDLLGSFGCRLVYRKYFIDDSQQSIKRRLNSIRPLDPLTVTSFTLCRSRR